MGEHVTCAYYSEERREGVLGSMAPSISDGGGGSFMPMIWSLSCFLDKGILAWQLRAAAESITWLSW